MVTGKKDIINLKHEAGGMRFQRVPPTEKRGRVHTSTVTGAVIENDVNTDIKYDLVTIDHVTNKKFNLKKIFRGNFDKLWL